MTTPSNAAFDLVELRKEQTFGGIEFIVDRSPDVHHHACYGVWRR